MEIVVKENDMIRSQYSHARLLRYLYAIPTIVAFGALLTRELVPILLSCLGLYVFGIFFLRHIRIYSFSDEHLSATWPKDITVRYDSIRIIINISPYDYYTHWLFIKYKRGFLTCKFNLCWIPTDQGIIEHLKSKGVKVRNLWFWQEK